MSNPFAIFVVGIFGVFFGMTLIFVSIHITAMIVDKLDNPKEANE